MSAAFEFTWDTVSGHERSWQAIFRAVNWNPESAHNIVEIGSFEGRTTVWILENLVRHPGSRVFCVDPFMATGAKEKEVAARLQLDWSAILRRFQSNIAATGKAHQVTLLQQPSHAALPSLLREAAGQVDFVYVDGSHRAPDVLSDLVFSYHLLRDGGLLLCDDYGWTLEARRAEIDVLSNPKIAVDAFATIFRRSLVPLIDVPLYQAAFVKMAEG
jgi:predicted O-methyltransferase YrrM